MQACRRYITKIISKPSCPLGCLAERCLLGFIYMYSTIYAAYCGLAHAVESKVMCGLDSYGKLLEAKLGTFRVHYTINAERLTPT